MKLYMAVHNYDALQIKGERWSAQADGWSSVWMLRSISTKESFQRNNNDGTCLHLWIRVYRSRGVCPHQDDHLCVGCVKEAA
jgi:hypothetical protein